MTVPRSQGGAPSWHCGETGNNQFPRQRWLPNSRHSWAAQRRGPRFRIHAPADSARALGRGARGRRQVGTMLKRVILSLLLAGVLCAAAMPSAAVTLPWTEDEAPSTGHLAIGLDVKAASQMLSSASAATFDGLRAARPTSGQGLLAGLIRAALRQAPWLASAEARGRWTWQYNPAAGVAIYGPGVGGYNSFSWSRKVGAPANAVASARSRQFAQHTAMLHQVRQNGGMGGGGGGGGGGSPTAVPLPPGAALLGAAIGMALLTRRLRRR